MWLRFFGKRMDFVQKKTTTWVREHSAGFWDWTPSFHIYSSCILYGTYCIQRICSYIYTNIYIYLKHTSTYTNIDFFFKKNVCNPKCCFSWSSQQRFLVLPLCGTEISAFIFYWLFLFTQKIQMNQWPPACLSVDSCRLHFVGTADRFCTWRKWRV